MINRKEIFSTILLLSLVGCGGSTSNGSSDSTGIGSADETGGNSKQYDLWAYMTPSDSHTNRYSIYDNNQTISYNTTYDVKQNRVIEVNDYASNEKTIYEKLSNKIKVSFEKDGKSNGMYELHLTANIGDIITERSSQCVLKKHYDTFTIKDKNFQDIIEIRCGNTPGYYQKGVGEIAQVEDDNQKVVRVLSN